MLDPSADNMDLYTFAAPDRPAKLTMTLDPAARYSSASPSVLGSYAVHGAPTRLVSAELEIDGDKALLV
jgi:hypothetical protein